MKKTLKGSRVEQEIKARLTGLTYIGDLILEDGFYVFNAKLEENSKYSPENTIFEIIELDTTYSGCYVRLKALAAFIDHLIFTDNVRMKKQAF